MGFTKHTVRRLLHPPTHPRFCAIFAPHWRRIGAAALMRHHANPGATVSKDGGLKSRVCLCAGTEGRDDDDRGQLEPSQQVDSPHFAADTSAVVDRPHFAAGPAANTSAAAVHESNSEFKVTKSAAFTGHSHKDEEVAALQQDKDGLKADLGTMEAAAAGLRGEVEASSKSEHGGTAERRGATSTEPAKAPAASALGSR